MSACSVEQIPTALLASLPHCWQPARHHSLSLKSSPRHSCLPPCPPAGSQSAVSGVPGLKTHCVACHEPHASSPVTCSRQAAPGLGLGKPHFFPCQFLTSGDECSGTQGGVGAEAPASLSLGLPCTALPTATSLGWGGQRWTRTHMPQGAFDKGSMEPHIR